ncbi:MAG: hypothetical protein ABSC06_25130, partial [Rhodopila sp.]
HAAFAIALAGKPEDLEHFLRRGLLTRLPDGGIDLPSKIGLKPKERPRVMLPGSGEQPLAQRFESAGDGENGDSETPPISLSERTVKTPQFHYPEDSEIPPISLSGGDVARPAAAAANAKESQTLSSSSSTGSRASGGDSEIRQFHCPPDSEIGGVTDINSQRSGLIETENLPGIGLANLTAELVALARLGRAANADDLGAVQAWSDAGDTPGQMRQAIEIKRRQIGDKAVSGLAYFNGCMKDARVRRRLPEATVALSSGGVGTQDKPAPAPLSPADQALIDRLRAVKHSYPPSLADFQAGAKMAQQAVRWLHAAEAWASAGWHRDLKPPDFTTATLNRATFEEDMLAVEEALTDPDPPGAAD